VPATFRRPGASFSAARLYATPHRIVLLHRQVAGILCMGALHCNITQLADRIALVLDAQIDLAVLPRPPGGAARR
jgi:hypothetical protein